MIQSSSSAFKPANEVDFAFTSLVDAKDKFPLVKKVFNEVMSPFYGEQQNILSDIEKRQSRKTEILTHRGKDVGCIVYKRDLCKNQLEVTLVALFDPAENNNKGYRTKLVERIEAVAAESRAEAICYTLPSSLNEHIDYFVHKKFEKSDLPQTGAVSECLLTKQLQQKRRKVEEVAKAPAATYTPAAPAAPCQHELTLKNQYIDPIRRGVKTIEGRINSGAPAKFKAGETLRLFSGNNSVTSTIAKIEKFASFRAMLEATDFKKCIPDARDLEAAVKIYDSIPNYSERAKQNGVLAIHLVNPK